MDKGIELAAFTEADVSALLEDDTFLGTERYHAHTNPKAILLAGQPGAGKTELSSMMALTLGGDAAFINGDDYRRYHPNYRKLFSLYGSDAVNLISPFSNTVVERMIEEFSDRHFHLVIEGTGRTVDVPRATAELLSKKGYTVELSAISVRPEISLISTLLRFYKMNESGTIPRATAAAAHDLVVQQLPGNLDILSHVSAISRLTIWNREQVLLFDSKIDRCTPSSVLLEHWNSPWLEEEIQSAEKSIALLREKEHFSRLGQEDVIDELEQRIQHVVQSQNIYPNMTFH